MTLIFLNGPVQNGDFTLAGKPGKAVGIRVAAALNDIIGNSPVPHLWNTTTLAGDLRYRWYSASLLSPVTRDVFETETIAAKYDRKTIPSVGIVSDADKIVTDMALNMIAEHLSRGTLTIRTASVQVCANCRHMTGINQNTCKSCGNTKTQTQRSRHLIIDRSPVEPVLNAEDIYAHNRRPPAHLQTIAGNVPVRLILSRTRNHGIDLTPIGLPGLVLDPRVAVHITALAVARQRGINTVVMLTTENAAANIAAYGQSFRQHKALRLLYALHGRISYDHMSDLRKSYLTRIVGTSALTTFENWFLPLAALNRKTGIPPVQLLPLLKHFRKADLASQTVSRLPERERLREKVERGDINWVERKEWLALALNYAQVGYASSDFF